jgi:predicted acetyltransferase
VIFARSLQSFWPKATRGIKKQLRISKDSFSGVPRRRSVATCCPAEFRKAHFGLSTMGKRFGCFRLRHTLNALFEELGGHIGYDVRPSERQRGYGTQILRLTLDKAREIGLRRVLITADIANVASWRVIEKNGGVLQSEKLSRHTGELLRKYWMEL